MLKGLLLCAGVDVANLLSARALSLVGNPMSLSESTFGILQYDTGMSSWVTESPPYCQECMDTLYLMI